MELTVKFLAFSSTILISLTTPVRPAGSCEPDSCHPQGWEVRYPFRLKDRQPDRCGDPRFELYCNSQNQTILKLPESGEFVVVYINYVNQEVLIDDIGSCLARRALNFNLTGSPFQGINRQEFSFFNCSDFSRIGGYWPERCLSGGINNTVVVAPSGSATPPSCRRTTTVSVPVLETIYGQTLFVLNWSEPAASCDSCKIDDRFCGNDARSGLPIFCSDRPSRRSGSDRPSRSGFPRSAKFAILVGVGVPGLICIIGLACYACGLVRTSRHRQLLDSELHTIRVSYDAGASAGLDRPTIESYPMTVLGESCRLPKPSDSTCPICLCEYEAKEALRSIPECNHYFHANCVDEWLRMNGSCPVCRNSPESSSNATPCSSTSLSSPETSLDR